MDKIVRIDYSSNEMKKLPIKGIAKLIGGGFQAYESTLGGRLFISGGEGSEGRLCEAVMMGEDSMRLEDRARMHYARFRHCMTLCGGGQCLMVTGGMEKAGILFKSEAATKECELYNIS